MLEDAKADTVRGVVKRDRMRLKSDGEAFQSEKVFYRGSGVSTAPAESQQPLAAFVWTVWL